MTITYKQAMQMVESHQAEPALKRFMGFVRHMSILCRTGQMQDHQAADDMLVMVALIHKLLSTPEGKRILRKSYKGKSYDVLKSFPPPSPEFDIGMQLLNGLISRDDAITQLRDQLNTGRDLQPDYKTIKSILDDILSYCAVMMNEFDLMASFAGLDDEAIDALGQDILPFQPKRNT